MSILIVLEAIDEEGIRNWCKSNSEKDSNLDDIYSLWNSTGDFMIENCKPTDNLDDDGEIIYVDAKYDQNKFALVNLDNLNFDDEQEAQTVPIDIFAKDVEIQLWNNDANASYIERNSITGYKNGLKYYKLDDVILYRYYDVISWCNKNGIPYSRTL